MSKDTDIVCLDIEEEMGERGGMTMEKGNV